MIQTPPTPGWSTIEARDLEAVCYAVIALGLNQLGTIQCTIDKLLKFVVCSSHGSEYKDHQPEEFKRSLTRSSFWVTARYDNV